MKENNKNFRPVDLDSDKCKGCINCMKRCPTEAIRVRNGKAKVIYEKCVGCGECVRICSHRAKRAVFDDLSEMDKFKYKIALPAPSLYGQFNNLDDIDYVLNGLKAIGFDDVFEVARGAELVTSVTRKMFENAEKLPKPLISTACPAILELILLRYSSLKKCLLRVLSPVEVSAKLAREKAEKETGLKPKEIGVFFISPCPAKVFALKRHVATGKQLVDATFPVNEIYFKLLQAMKNLTKIEPIKHSGIIGIGWAGSGGEASGVLKDKILYADGIENCIRVLTEFENDAIHNVDFVELNACPGGCVGGVANIENPFVAKSKLQELRKFTPVSFNKLEHYGKPLDYYMWARDVEENDSLVISNNKREALKKMAKIEELEKILPALDCGACGAPSCRAFAEDVALSFVDKNSCTRINDK